ncbi:hypothetical protein [Massilia sp. NR 4-1]|uniref:hypothetical protein n=1 Tax=Massilia sp. NR 4-1 TaxID=1678028 RepID=UPI00067B2234|nr:hypothetical protein [Massilia sp. NR 4-1]AKU21014.1 hypothetical protein ACZ75_05440 [Massilia sp. NR 4-1]
MSIQFLGAGGKELAHMAEGVREQCIALFGGFSRVDMDVAKTESGSTIRLRVDASDAPGKPGVDVVVAMEHHHILDNVDLLREGVMCLVADTGLEHGAARATSSAERAQVEEAVRRCKAWGYWVPIFEELLAAGLPPAAGAIAMQSVLNNLLGINEMQSDLSLQPLGVAQPQAFARLER